MAWRRSGDKPLSKPMMVSLPTHICVTRPQWVKVGIRGVGLILYQFLLTVGLAIFITCLHTIDKNKPLPDVYSIIGIMVDLRRLVAEVIVSGLFIQNDVEWMTIRRGATDHSTDRDVPSISRDPSILCARKVSVSKVLKRSKKFVMEKAVGRCYGPALTLKRSTGAPFKFTSNLQLSSDQHNACSIPQKWCSKHSPSLNEYVVAKAPPTNLKKIL